MDEFARLTRHPDGAPLYVKRCMVAVVTPFRGVTHVVLTNEDVDYEVRESPEQVLRKLKGDENCEMSPLTVQTQSGIMQDRKDKSCRHRRFNRGSGSADSSSSPKPESKSPRPEPVVEPIDADATVARRS